MGPLVNILIVQELKSGAGMVNLIEVGGVPPAGLTFEGILLIYQVGRIRVVRRLLVTVLSDDNGRVGNDVAICILENDFIEDQPILARQDAYISAGKLLHAGKIRGVDKCIFIIGFVAGIKVLPGEAHTLGHLCRIGIRPAIIRLA